MIQNKKSSVTQAFWGAVQYSCLYPVLSHSLGAIRVTVWWNSGVQNADFLGQTHMKVCPLTSRCPSVPVQHQPDVSQCLLSPSLKKTPRHEWTKLIRIRDNNNQPIHGQRMSVTTALRSIQKSCNSNQVIVTLKENYLKLLKSTQPVCTFFTAFFYAIAADFSCNFSWVLLTRKKTNVQRTVSVDKTLIWHTLGRSLKHFWHTLCCTPVKQ